MSLLAPFSSLPTDGRKARAVASLLGATVADAAARPLHWIYDEKVMQGLLQQNRNPEFWPESMSPFYSLPTGSRSCYNHVVMVGLKAFVECGGGPPDLAVYRKLLTTTFGEGTEWQEALARRKEAYSPAKRRGWKQEPVEGPWLHGAVISFLEKGSGDPDNTEMDGFLLSLPHLLFRVEKTNVVEECLAISSLLCVNKIYPRLQAEILRTLLLTRKVEEEIVEELEESAGQVTQEVFDYLNKKHELAVEMFGNNCHLPGSFQGSLHGFLQLIQDGESDLPESGRFMTAVRATIKVGGCNCSRANYLGALAGAAGGLRALPPHWLEQVTDMSEIVKEVAQALELGE